MTAGQPAAQHVPEDSGTAPAPPERDIELVCSFLNTLDSEDGTDTLAAEPGWRAWVADRELGPAGGLHRALSTRAALRAAVGDGTGAGSATATVTVRVGPGGGPGLDAGDAVGEVLAAAARLAVLGLWERVKICPAGDCRWAFYDRSRNRSRTWCSMRVCGNREKGRIWREKHA